MIDYDTIDNTQGAFPDVVSQNVTAPGAIDGTPFIKDFIDDLWGHNQDLMELAGLTPNASGEEAGDSQRSEAIRRIGGYPGTVIAWMGNTDDPASNYGVRLLELRGQGVLRSAYPELDDKCFVGSPNNPTAPAFYRADDAAGTIRNALGDYLILPDTRGLAIRGLDLTGTEDPDGATREIGDLQTQKTRKHIHALSNQDGANEYGLQRVDYDDLGSAGTNDRNVEVEWGVTVNNLIMRASDTIMSPSSQIHDSETRMDNTAARWAIYY